MRKITLLLITLPFFGFSQDTLSALFLGNSYTGVNQLYNLVDSVANHNGDDLIHDRNTPGGYTFEGHSINTTSLNKITAQDWDFVILQEQSQKPSFPPAQVDAETKPYAVVLNDSIKANNPCTEALFYMTWGRENGDQSNCTDYPPLCTYEGMQQRLRESYMEMAEENNASVAPIGVAWKRVREEYPAIDLYTNDGSHPSAAGSYLAACVFYSSMYRKSTIGNSYHFSLDAATALTLQTIASETVLDSLDMWRIGANDISLELTNDTASCMTTSIELTTVGMYETISWQDNSTDTFFVAMQSGVYTATVSNVHGCEISKSTNVSLGESLLDTIHITGCDSVEVFGDYYHTDTAVVDTFMQGNGCDSIVVVYIEMDTTTETTIHFQQTFPVKKNYVGIIFEYYVSFGDSIAITDSLYQTIYSSTELNEHGYIYVCDSNTISDLYHLIVYKPCKNDTVDLFAYCSAVSIDDLDYTQWTISPNPTNDIINIHSQEKEGFAIAIFDVIGNEILVKRRTENNELTVDISNWSKGIYYLMIYDENDVPIGQTKIMKQ